MDEWNARADRLRTRRDIAKITGLPDSHVRDLQGLVNRAENVIRKLL